MTLPSVIVTAETIAMAVSGGAPNGEIARITTSSAARAAILETPARKAAMGSGAPS